MDVVDKRTNGVQLNARDEQRLRNHQLRMMRRAWLQDMKVSPREPLWPGNDIYFGKAWSMRKSTNFHNYWKLLSDKLFLPKGVRPFYHPAFADELLYGRIQNVPRLALWGMFRSLRFIVFIFPVWFTWKFLVEENILSKYPTCYGMFTAQNRGQHYAARLATYPSDKTFTTRLRNVEWGHDTFNIEAFTPRMRPGAEEFPPGTRMNWVTFQPIYPEENILQSADYGNGPGGLGNMTETYRLVHATKPHGLHSKVDPDEPYVIGGNWSRWLWRVIFNKNQVGQYEESKDRQWTMWHASD